MDTDTQILRPLALIVPKGDAVSLTAAEIGTLVMSGAKLYVCVSAGTFQLVTSA